MVERQHRQQSAVAVEAPFLPLEGRGVGHFNLKAPARGSDALGRIPGEGKPAARIGAFKGFDGRPVAVGVAPGEFRFVRGFALAFRQHRGKRHRNLVDGFGEADRAEGQLGRGSVDGDGRPLARLERQVLLPFGEGNAAVAADFHAAGQLRFDDAVDGQLGRGVVVDGTGMVGRFSEGKIVHRALG